MATALNCGELDALAELLTAVGHADLAARWIDAYAKGDNPDDAHDRESN
ncbi:hypothetical protein [Nonomuraea solani]|nr:hypothetical protein [Nonomuraea solani]